MNQHDKESQVPPVGPNYQSDNGYRTAATVGKRRFSSSWPLLIVAALFVIGAFLTWYFTWFGRELSPADISTYLADSKPRKIQHALLQVQQRIERGEEGARQWYPQLIALANHPETEIRLTLAWVMGFDNRSDEFHETLLKLLKDSEPIVRRNAALALVRFGDNSGRSELLAVFEPYPVKVDIAGTLSNSLKPGATVSRAALIARLQTPGSEVEIRSPLPGKVEGPVKESGAAVQPGELILTIRSDEDSVWEALRGLALIGEGENVQTIQKYLHSGEIDDRLKEQAALTIQAIENRSNKKSN